jgi:hypothetical protein
VRQTNVDLTLLSVVVHEDRGFFRDTVNVGCFPDHLTAMIATRLDQADVIAHDEHDAGFLVLRSQGGGCADEYRCFSPVFNVYKYDILRAP